MCAIEEKKSQDGAWEAMSVGDNIEAGRSFGWPASVTGGESPQ